MKSILRNIFSTFAVAAALVSCTKVEKEVVIRHRHTHAFIMMSFGFNDIGSYLKKNIREMENGFIPDGGNEENLLFLYSHNAGADGKMAAPTLTRIYLDETGALVRENVMTFSVTDIPNTGENISKVLGCIHDKYQADSYGMLISSHGTGWVPPGYMSKPDSYENGAATGQRRAMTAGHGRRYTNGPVDYVPRDAGDGPVVKSIGVTWTDDTMKSTYETDIMELADAIPFKMEYIIFDACYMGGVEIAYELKDKCRWLCASQTEILGDGMDYKQLLQRLLKDGGPDPEAVCSDFFSLYESQAGTYRSATVSMIDCSRTDVLAAVCRSIFRKHDISYDSCDKVRLQQFFRNRNRNTQKWFYDLRSIMAAAGADEVELADLDWALEQCVVYKAATEWFMNDFEIKTFCGMSMYLPYPERNYLNSYYKELAWNKTTGLLRGE